MGHEESRRGREDRAGSPPELDADTAAAEIRIVNDLVWTPEAKQHGIGYMDAEKMRVTRDVITQTYDLKVTVPPDELYTNALLPR